MSYEFFCEGLHVNSSVIQLCFSLPIAVVDYKPLHEGLYVAVPRQACGSYPKWNCCVSVENHIITWGERGLCDCAALMSACLSVPAGEPWKWRARE